MVPTVDRAKATVMTKVQFDAIDPRILPEMSAKVSFLSQEVTPSSSKPRLAVIADALVARGRGCSLSPSATAKAVERSRASAAEKIGDLSPITGDVRSGEKPC
jgi:hypothetical protein